MPAAMMRLSVELTSVGVGFIIIIIIIWAQVTIALWSGCWKHNDSALILKNWWFFFICVCVLKSSYSATYCQSNWCPPQSLVEVWIQLSASGDHSSPDPGRTCASSPQWFHLETKRKKQNKQVWLEYHLGAGFTATPQPVCEKHLLWHPYIYTFVVRTFSKMTRWFSALTNHHSLVSLSWSVCWPFDQSSLVYNGSASLQMLPY